MPVTVARITFPPSGVRHFWKSEKLICVITLSICFWLLELSKMLATSHSPLTRLKNFFLPLKAAVFQLPSNWDVLSLCIRQIMGGMDGNKAGKGWQRDKETKRHCYVHMSNNDSQYSRSLKATWFSKVTLLYWCEISQVTSWFLSGRGGFHLTGQQWHDRSVSMGTHLSLTWSMAKVLEGNHQWGLQDCRQN